MSIAEDVLILASPKPKFTRDLRPGDLVFCLDRLGRRAKVKITSAQERVTPDVLEVVFEDGYSLECTMDQEFLTERGQTPLWEIFTARIDVLCSSELNPPGRSTKPVVIPGGPGHASIFDSSDLVRTRIASLSTRPGRRCVSLKVDRSTQNFILPNGVVTCTPCTVT